MAADPLGRPAKYSEFTSKTYSHLWNAARTFALSQPEVASSLAFQAHLIAQDTPEIPQKVGPKVERLLCDRCRLPFVNSSCYRLDTNTSMPTKAGKRMRKIQRRCTRPDKLLSRFETTLLKRFRAANKTLSVKCTSCLKVGKAVELPLGSNVQDGATTSHTLFAPITQEVSLVPRLSTKQKKRLAQKRSLDRSSLLAPITDPKKLLLTSTRKQNMMRTEDTTKLMDLKRKLTETVTTTVPFKKGRKTPSDSSKQQIDTKSSDLSSFLEMLRR